MCKGSKVRRAIAFSIYFKSYPDAGYTRNARCPFWLLRGRQGEAIALPDQVSSASVFVTREGLMDRFAIGRGAGRAHLERVVEGKRIRNT